MICISHRGNTEGAVPETENSPEAIDKALALDLQVEVDVWECSGELFLGHDSPQHKVDEDFLIDRALWSLYHAKNPEAIRRFSANKKYHWFWHGQDRFTITSWGYPITHVHYVAEPGTIELCFQRKELQPGIVGVCSDYPLDYMQDPEGFINPYCITEDAR